MSSCVDTHNEIPRDGDSKDDPVKPEDLKESQPSIRLSRIPDGRYLYDGSDDCDAEINPIAFASEEVPPVDNESYRNFHDE